MPLPNDLSILLNNARINGWCTRLYCTTCGSHQFRKELAKFDRQALIAQLRELDESYFANRDPILLIIYQAAALPMAQDLLEPLGDTPAGRFLRKAIEIQEIRDRNRQQQLADSSPEALAKRAAKRKEARRQLTEEHRIRKALNARRIS